MGTPRYRLKLTSLRFISAVDLPAQETATARLLKRAGDGDGFQIRNVAPIVKVDDELGLVFAWAWTGAVDGEPYHDLHGDAIVDDDEMLKVAAEFMAGARATDEMHDREADGHVVFGMPMTPQIAKAFGIVTETTGFMVAIKPSPEVFAKFKSGEFTGLSIDGMGIREPVTARKGATEIAAMKRALLTTDDEGHAHLVDGDAMDGTTSGADMPTAATSGYHYHPFVKGEDGSIEIGAALGHTHGVKQPKAASAIPVPAPTTTTTEKAMTTDADKIKQLEADLAKANTEITKLKAPAPKEVFKAADGSVFTEADDPRLVEMAKRSDADRAALESERIEKRAGEICKHLGSTVAVKAAIVKALDSIGDQATRDAAFALLAGADAAMKAAQIEVGAKTATAVEGSAQARIDAFIADYRKAKGVDRGVAITKLTTPGPDFNAEAADAYEQAQLDRVAN